jgi:hypothetical protein
MNAMKALASTRSAPDQAPWLREGVGYVLAIIVVSTQLFAGLTFVMFR